MSDHPERWPKVGKAIEARRKALGLTKAELQREAFVSDKTLAGYVAGLPVVRADKARDLIRALGWPSDAFDQIAAGKDLTHYHSGPAAVGLAELLERVEALEGWRFAVESASEVGSLGLAAKSSDVVDEARAGEAHTARSSGRRARPSPPVEES